MGYDLHITRRAHWSDDGDDISAEESLALVATDPELQLGVANGPTLMDGNRFTVTRIPTATSGSWFVVHDAFEVWAAVAIDDFSGDIVGWRNPPDEKHRRE